MSSLTERGKGKVFWRSLDDLADTPEFREFVKREFPATADEMLAPSRRDFLKLMGASIALAGVTGCRRWPAEQVVPFAHRPEGFVPGVPVQYATAMDLDGAATGLLVTSYDGRPIKIEGNPSHPASLGATTALAQATVLQVYDPDRSTNIVEIDGGKTRPRSWDEFAAALGGVLQSHRGSGGSGLRVLAGASSSPSRRDLRARFAAAFPRAGWHEYEPFSRDAEREGLRLAFGKSLRARYALDRAEVVISLDGDLLFGHPDALRHAREFARWRRAHDRRMNRLYAVETSYSVTGGSADHRIPAASRRIPAIAAHLGAELARLGLALPAIPAPGGAALSEAERRGVAAMAADVAKAKTAGLVVAGPKQPPAVHALAHAINAALGAVGSTVTYAADPDGDRPSHADSIRDLSREMASGSVDTLIVLGGNPAFNAPSDLEFAAALARVKTTVHLALHLDETSLACRWHVPQAHFLESWGDSRAWDGTVSVVQPLIEPLYGGKSEIELLAFVCGDAPAKGYDIVRRTMRGILGETDFEKRWRQALHDGVVASSALPPETPAAAPATWTSALGASAAAAGDGLEVVFERDAKIHDGRFANVGWLQEMPDPVSKMTWDNPAWIAPETAEAQGLRTGDVVLLHCGGRSLEIPVFVSPGQAAGSISVFPGYGRRQAGNVGDGVGFDVYPLRTSEAPVAATARLEKTGRRYEMATTQDHYVVDTLGRTERDVRAETLVREAELSTYLEEPDFAKHVVHVPEEAQLWEPHKYDGYKWGMAIDLTACIGCGACTIACQAENNIPVVGKSEVMRGREMHWIRVDRYFHGPPEAPSLAFQPLTCHHCENAPCETVCPVGATMHDHEGLNVMVYNRCIGTRYCSNNCPYKVRRFNWFNNHKHPSAVEMMVYNPEVTLRSRGVMEKCTFCIQRIEGAKIRAKNDLRRVRDGEIVTACQQVCPTEAIVFGDLNDPDSRVRKLHDDARSYGVLEEINTKPRLKYLARLRNRSADAGAQGEGKA